MLTRIGQILEQLYSETYTPRKSKDYLSNPDIVSYVQRVRNILAKEHPTLGVLDIEVEAIVLFLLELMSVRISLEGILLVKMPIIYMTDTAISLIKSDKQDTQTLQIVRDIWFKVLEKQTKEVKKLFLHRPDYEACPLLTFHAVAYEASLLPADQTTPFYEAYAFGLHLDIRFNQFLPKIDPGTHLTYVRAARSFFVHVSPEIKQRRHHTLKDIPEYLEDFRINRIKKDDIEKETVALQIAHFTALRSRKIVKPHPRISKSTSHNRKIRAITGPSDGNDAESTAPPQFIIHGIELPPPPDPYAKLDFVDKLGMDYVSVPGDLNISSSDDKSERLRHYMDYVHVRNFPFFWEQQYLGLFPLSILYQALDEARTGSDQFRTVALFLYFLIHTGINHDTLLDAIPAGDDLAADMIGIKEIDGFYYLLNPCQIQTQHNAGCQPTSTHVHIPVPKFLSDMFPGDVMSRTNIFSFIQENREIHITTYDIKNFLKKVSLAYKVYDLNITIGNIGNSFLPLYCSFYGLDPILCCHISGEDRHELYGSQLHYIHIPAQLLASRYRESFAIVHCNILANLNACIEYGFIGGKKIDTLPLERQFEPNVLTIPGYGSSSTPEPTTVRDLVISLLNALNNQTDIVSRHNLFTCYLFLAIQFGTGYRPLASIKIPKKRYNEHSGILVIIDKDSAEYYEQRLLPLTSLAKSLINALWRGLPATNDFVVRNQIISDQTEMFDNLLFLVDDKGRFIEFTPEGFIQTLRAQNIDYPFPMNMPRHYLRNHLYHIGISNDLADAWLGHQHDGREILNVTSSTQVGVSLLNCLAVVEDMLSQIGFSYVEYQREKT